MKVDGLEQRSANYHGIIISVVVCRTLPKTVQFHLDPPICTQNESVIFGRFVYKLEGQGEIRRSLVDGLGQRSANYHGENDSVVVCRSLVLSKSGRSENLHLN